MTSTSLHKSLQYVIAALSLSLAVGSSGCGSSNANSETTAQAAPQPYFAPYVYNTTNAGALLQQTNLYALDDTANPPTFTQSIFGLPRGSQIINTGTMTKSSRGLLSLSITANYVPSGGGSYIANTFDPPQTGSFAFELSDKSGAFVQIVSQPPAPAVEALNCPNSKTARTYLFLTIPGGQINSATQGSQPPFWDPSLNTAYGTVDLTSDGTNVTLSNIHQFTLPSVGGSGAPANPSASTKTGLCGSTVLGNTISVPGKNVTTDPGSDPVTVAQAAIGIGSSGMLVEDNGLIPVNQVGVGLYENALGDGTGAIGIPKPTSPVDVNALRGAQYLGFIYNAGHFNNASSVATGWSSHVASFGFTTIPTATCSGVAASTATILYGGSFPSDNPALSPDGFGNCNFAIDFGAQDATNNGVFPHATVTVGSQYPVQINTKPANYSFSAVAITGQLNGKYAVFLLGTDSIQPWMVELLQSN